MLLRIIMALSLSCVLSVSTTTMAGWITETQTFDTATSVTTAGWVFGGTLNPGEAMGFINANTAGGAAAGEGQVLVGRNNGAPNRWYADITLGGSGSFTLAQPFTAAGKLRSDNVSIETGHGRYLAFLDQNTIETGRTFVGLKFDDDVHLIYNRAILQIVSNGSLLVGSNHVDLLNNTNYDLQMSWNPAADVFTATLDDGINPVLTMIMNNLGAYANIQVNAFGWIVPAVGHQLSPLGDARFDDLMYAFFEIDPVVTSQSNGIPEPAALTLLMLAGVTALRRGGRYRGTTSSHDNRRHLRINASGRTMLSLLTLFMFAGLARATVVSETQTFDSAASAAAAGWSQFGTLGSNELAGFINANTAGGASAGELQARFGRNPSDRGYADFTFGGAGSFGFDTPFTFSGRFRTGPQGNDVGLGKYIGFFDSSKITAGTTFNDVFVGFRYHDSNNTGITDAWLLNGSGSLTAEGNDVNLNHNTNYNFVTTWNPTGGVHGEGRLQVVFTGTGGGTTAFDINAATKATLAGLTLDAFGLYTPGVNFENQSPPNHRFDDLTYAFGVNEPSITTIPGNGGTLAFGNVRIGTVAELTVTVDNTGDPATTLSGTYPTLTGLFTGPHNGGTSFNVTTGTSNREYRYIPTTHAVDAVNMILNSNGGSSSIRAIRIISVRIHRTGSSCRILAHRRHAEHRQSRRPGCPTWRPSPDAATS